ncbi:hypothetical protein BG74_06720 [Sodalis-like endosymbiont of Proechinophthirus fluctus]|nr:hypothetical protein BG74_06720 [Sodalis-like endosymbiont of Proechinophthirus fluctus]
MTCILRAPDYDLERLARAFSELNAVAVAWLDAEQVPAEGCTIKQYLWVCAISTIEQLDAATICCRDKSVGWTLMAILLCARMVKRWMTRLKPLIDAHDLQMVYDTEDGVVRPLMASGSRFRRERSWLFVGKSGYGKRQTYLSIMRLIEKSGRITGVTIGLRPLLAYFGKRDD